MRHWGKTRNTLLSLIAVSMMTSGCSVIMAASRSSYRGDVAVIKEGAPRTEVLAELGQPDSFSKTETGGFDDRYVLDPDAHRGRLFHAVPLGVCRHPVRNCRPRQSGNLPSAIFPAGNVDLNRKDQGLARSQIFLAERITVVWLWVTTTAKPPLQNDSFFKPLGFVDLRRSPARLSDGTGIQRLPDTTT